MICVIVHACVSAWRASTAKKLHAEALSKQELQYKREQEELQRRVSAMDVSLLALNDAAAALKAGNFHRSRRDDIVHP